MCFANLVHVENGERLRKLEESFDIELPDEETTKLKTVQDAADLIQTKL